MTRPGLGALVQAFFLDYLAVQKGLRPSSIKAYRDAIRLFLIFAAADRRCAITRLSVEELTLDRVLRFLSSLESDRHNHVRTRNHRRAVLVVFFEYLARRQPEQLGVSQQIAAIPVKRAPPPETRFLERDDVATLLKRLPTRGPHALRNRVLLLFLYNTGARVQEIADLRIEHIELDPSPRARLHGKGDKWRTCPLWPQTATQLRQLLDERRAPQLIEGPVFVSHLGRPLTRFGIYKIVRRLSLPTGTMGFDAKARPLSPHVFRHTAAVHLLEAGVDVNVIRGWLGHVSLQTTNRYAEINARMKEAALRLCEPPLAANETSLRRAVWRDDAALLSWLHSL
jgi:site-specific recombinase XerD